MKRLFCLLLSVLLLFSAPAVAEEEEAYTTYEQFISRYSDDLEFINTNESRHLISLIFATGETKGSLRYFSLAGDRLTADLYTKGSGRLVAGLKVDLLSPSTGDPNSAEYKDFVTSGYQCYALLMAMVDSGDLLERYSLVSELNNGVSGADEYRTQVGPYALTARRTEAGMSFTFSSVYWEDPIDLLPPESEDDFLPEEDGDAPEEGESEDDVLPVEEEDSSRAG